MNDPLERLEKGVEIYIKFINALIDNGKKEKILFKKIRKLPFEQADSLNIKILKDRKKIQERLLWKNNLEAYD